MVFYGLASGLLFGLSFPMICDEQIYLFLAATFLRPHLKFKLQQEKRHKDLALRADHLDAYTKDIFKSLLFFTLSAPFVFHKVYWKREGLFDEKAITDEAFKLEDTAVTLLKQVKGQQATTNDEQQEQEADPPTIQAITFSDYEKFMQKLEKERKLDQFNESNPRAQIEASRKRKAEVDEQFKLYSK